MQNISEYCLNCVWKGHFRGRTKVAEYSSDNHDGWKVLHMDDHIIGIAALIFLLIGLINLYVYRNFLAKFKRNEQHYKSLYDQNPDVIVTFDLKGNYISANPAVFPVSGYQVEEIIQSSLIALVVPEYVEKTLEYFQIAVGGKSINYETALFHKNGHHIYFNVTNVPIIVDHKVVGVYGIAKDITERKNTKQMIEQLAYHDHLTGLPNRFLFKKIVGELLSDRNQPLAFLLIDLDRFKNINDLLGQQNGDSILADVVERLRSSLEQGEQLFRHNGDEFILLVPKIDQQHQAENVAQRILKCLVESFTQQHYEFRITASIGISQYPNDGDNIETIMNNADAALAYVKKQGKNNYKSYTPQLNQKSYERLQLEMLLYKALERNEFIIYYQPQINLKTGEINGIEALIRWIHPEQGMISPDTFIPIAEETGLIVPIGEWALRTACRQNKLWQDAGLPPMIVSVNLSPRQFLQHSIVETIGQVLEETGLDPKYLDLEITESMTMNVQCTISVLQNLSGLGVKISIDDFGTGYSSLHYLKKFPIDKLKIDQSFVRESTVDSNDATIVRTIISMAHHLKLQVVAEGVETREQLIFLQQHLCDAAQGYFFSKPLPPAEFEKKYEELQQMVKNHGLPLELSESM